MAKLNKNGDFNSINKDTMPLDTRVRHEYDKADTVRLDSRRGYENDKADTMPLDTRIESEYDNSASSCHSGLRAGIQRGDNLMPKAFRFSQSGRSMVEMLGTLAIIGVLSIGGIMGYSYAVDKYHANQIMNDVNLRAIDLIAQASRGGDLSLAEWPTKTSADYDIGLEVDEATNTTEGGIYVKDVEKRICEIIADDLLPEEVELVIDGEAYTSGNCGETNKMVFYYDAVGEALGETCNGPIVDGVCQPCSDDKKWNASIGECLCADPNKFLNNGIISWEDNDACISCPCNATVSADGKSCICPEGYEWGYGSVKNVCYSTETSEGVCPAGEMLIGGSHCQSCDDIDGTYYHSCEKGCICERGKIMNIVYGNLAVCYPCPAAATQYDENGVCLCPNGSYPEGDEDGTYCR